MSARRALLINPPVPSRRCAGREGRCTGEGQVELLTLVPLSLIYPAAVLERRGWIAEVRDGVAAPLGELNAADLVLINVSPTTYEDDMSLVRTMKDEAPDAHVTVTGTLPTAQPARLLADGADSVLLGEIEGTVDELAARLEGGRPPADIPGLVTGGPGGKVVNGPRRPFLELDALPYPARHLIDLDRYRFVFTGERYTTVLAGRGCPHMCSFCTAPLLYGRRARYRDPAAVVEEVAHVVRELDIPTVAFYADTFTQDRRFVLELCQRLVAEDLDVGWTCNARVDTVDAEMLTAMKRAGCRYIFYGLESGSPEVLSACNKGITPDQVREAAKLTREAGLEIVFSAMIGLPGETRETVRQTLDLILEVDADYCSFFVASPYEGTPFHEEVAQSGNLAGDIMDERHAAVRTDALTPEEIEELADEAFRTFILRPRVFAREAAKVVRERRWDEVRVGLGMLRGMVLGR